MGCASWSLGACFLNPLPSRASHQRLFTLYTAARMVFHHCYNGRGLVEAAVSGFRYFGGTKLGTGGLVRAYGQAARECLRLAEKTTYHRQVACSMQV